MNNPEWTRVIALRDPKDRILSAYLGKEYRFHTKPRRASSVFRKACFNYKCGEFELSDNIKDCMHHNYTFSEFLDVIQNCRNVHWDPQHTLIDDWECVNFVINFNDLARGAEKLLRKLGDDVWETFGKTGWGLNGTSAVFQENTHHSSGASDKYNEFYTPEIEKIVEKMYACDYDLLRKYFPEDYKKD